MATNGRRAIGYIRRSNRVDPEHGMSWELQENAVRALAARYGVDDLELLSDWGKSGGEGKAHLRTGWIELRRRIEAGGVNLVFGYAADRMARSLMDLLTFYRTCDAAGVKVVYHDGGEQDFRTPEGRLRLQIMGSIAEFQRAQTVEKLVESHRIRRERGERVGRAPYGSKPGEDPALVVVAYREAGSLNGAASILNAAHVPTSLGGAHLWSLDTVRAILEREAPGTLPRGMRKGSRPETRGAFTLYHLLRCACGRPLTASRLRGDPMYRCQAAEHDPNHPRPYRVRESQLLQWVRDEADHLDLGGDAAQEATDDAAIRAELDARLARAGEAYTDGMMTRERMAEVKAETEAELDKLAAVATVRAIPPAVWDGPGAWTPAMLNRWLRAFLVSVNLGPDMRPVDATWRNRALRRP